MWFNSLDFLCFLSIVVPLYYLIGAIRSREGLPRVVFLLAASYFFYMYWNPAYILLIVASTVLDYCCGLLFLRWPRERGRWIIALSATGNLLLLASFKYSRFFYLTLSALLGQAGVELPPWPRGVDVLLPVGISFYTFQTMSYTIDIYRGKAHVERNFFRFALFVAFFAQLVAGPIEKARDLLVQMRTLRTARPLDVQGALLQITYGLFKKVAVADSIAQVADPVFASPERYSGAMILSAAVLFGFQIYCDFSGYSDIAIGVAKLFGIRLSLNFFFPYFARNVRQFWRCWHISLSSWLREYLYISLGGNRRGRRRTYANLMITMLLGGLWHGASWNFVLWGFLHGVYLCIHRLISPHRPEPAPPREGATRTRRAFGVVGAGLSIAGTFLLVSLTWIPFRCPGLGETVACFRRLASWAHVPFEAMGLDAGLLGMCWALAGLLLLFDLFFRLEWAFWRGHGWTRCVRSLLPALFVLLTLIFGAEKAQQFIYFQF